MSLLYLYFRKFSKLCLTPNYSPLQVRRPTFIIESIFSTFLTCIGLRFTIMKSCQAKGPNLSVILLVSSLETGFSMNHASCTYSLLRWKLVFEFSISNGSVATLGLSSLSLDELPKLFFFWIEGKRVVKSSILYLKSMNAK